MTAVEPDVAATRRADIGVNATEVSGGCCGLECSWDFENAEYDIPLQCGEHALLPAIRDAADDTLIIADGLSCKTQIELDRHGKMGDAAVAGDEDWPATKALTACAERGPKASTS